MNQKIERAGHFFARIAARGDQNEAGGPLGKVQGKFKRDRAAERMPGDRCGRYVHGRHEVADELGVAPVRVRKCGGLVGVAGAGEVEYPDLVRAAQRADAESHNRRMGDAARCRGDR